MSGYVSQPCGWVACDNRKETIMSKPKNADKVTCCGNVFPFGAACPTCGTRYGGGMPTMFPAPSPRKSFSGYSSRSSARNSSFGIQALIIICVTIIVVALILSRAGGAV